MAASQVQVDGGTVDLRFSSMPTIHGEKIVAPDPGPAPVDPDLNQLGLPSRCFNLFKALLKRPYGLILVCGPTGSGRPRPCTRPFTMLNVLEKNIITIEDPVKYSFKASTRTRSRNPSA